MLKSRRPHYKIDIIETKKRTIMHYIRTFFKALQMTLRGETIPTPASRYPNLQAWLTQAQNQLEQVYKVAEDAGLDKTAREQIILKLDGRAWSMELILSSLKFHLESEFPSLMASVIEHNLTTLYALHLDDKYRVSQLAQSEQLPESLRSSVQVLSEILLTIPPSNNP